MPAALYAADMNIVWSTQQASGVTPREVRGRLLCDDCEGRFNRYGESEVLRWIAPKKTDERLPVLACWRAWIRSPR